MGAFTLSERILRHIKLGIVEKVGNRRQSAAIGDKEPVNYTPTIGHQSSCTYLHSCFVAGSLDIAKEERNVQKNEQRHQRKNKE